MNTRSKMYEYWLTPNKVFTEYKKIRTQAMKSVKVWEEYVLEPDYAIRNQAIKFYGKIKDYLDDDWMNVMNFFKYDQDRVNKILAIWG